MLKKILSLLLCLAMLAGCSAFAEEAAPAADKHNLGTISINGAFTLKAALPEGYSLGYQLASQDELIATLVKKDDPAAPQMMLHIAFDETYSDVARMNDLSQEDLELLEKTFTDQDPTVEISYATTSYGTLLMVIKQLDRETDYLELFSIYRGYFIEYVVTAPWNSEDRNLTESEILPCVAFLSELDFVPAEEQNAPDLVNKSYTAEIVEYDEENNTARMILKDTVLLMPDAVKALAVGDSLVLGDETVQIETLSEEDGVFLVNGEYEISRTDETGAYQVSVNGEVPCLQTVGTLDIPIPETIEFWDSVAPETFEALDEPVKHTAAEFISILTAHDEADVGFTSDNICAVFDDQGQLTTVIRFYAPWQ